MICAVRVASLPEAEGESDRRCKVYRCKGGTIGDGMTLWAQASGDGVHAWWWITPAVAAVTAFGGGFVAHLSTRSRERESRRDTDRRKWRDEGASLVANLRGLVLGIQPSLLRTLPPDTQRPVITTAYSTWGPRRAELYRLAAGHTDRPRLKPIADALEAAVNELVDACMAAHLMDERRSKSDEAALREVLAALRNEPGDDPPRPSWMNAPEGDVGNAWDDAETAHNRVERELSRFESVNAGDVPES